MKVKLKWNRVMMWQCAGILLAGSLGCVIGCQAEDSILPHVSANGEGAPAPALDSLTTSVDKADRTAEPAAKGEAAAKPAVAAPAAATSVACPGTSNSGWGGYSSWRMGTSYTSGEQACAVCRNDLIQQAKANAGTFSCACSGSGGSCTGTLNARVLNPSGDCQIGSEPHCDKSGKCSLTSVTCSDTVSTSYTCSNPTCSQQCCNGVNPNNVCNTMNQCVPAGCKCGHLGENHDQSWCVADGNSCSSLGGILDGCGPSSGCP